MPSPWATVMVVELAMGEPTKVIPFDHKWQPLSLRGASIQMRERT
jgi:hypothetical protein